MKNDTAALSKRMSKRLANFKLDDATVERLADKVLIDGLSVVRFDPCIYGICIDYITDKWPQFDRVPRDRNIAKWEVFPYGIIDWDHFHVRVAFEVDELEGRGLNREFGH